MKKRVVENVLKLNDEIAQINRQTLQEAGVVTINLIGAPGCGKTTLFEQTLQILYNQLKTAVLVGDLTTQRDADRMSKYNDQVIQINTGKGCHLDANQVRQGLAQLDLQKLDLLFIENVGNLICPVGFDLGEDFKVGMFSISEGDDKCAKHPYLVSEADLILLNKTDLLCYVPFDLERFRADLYKLNPTVQLIECCALGNKHLEPWICWLNEACFQSAKALEPKKLCPNQTIR